MIQNCSRWKVLQVFFDDPNPKEGFTIRWISKEIRLATTSVKNHLNKLSRSGSKDYGYPLVIKSKGISYPTYWANKASELFRFYKKMDMLFRIEESRLPDFLVNKLHSDLIILFGSASRGEDTKTSDVDLFILSEEKEIHLKKYEDILKRKISLHFNPRFDSIPKELRNNILNGVILRGYVKVYD